MANFRSKKKQNKSGGFTEIKKVKLPQGTEVLGVLEQRLGASRNRVRCFDGITRVCNVPGRLKRRLWLRENDLVIVKPWEFGGDTKGEILHKYRYPEVEWLRKKGYLKSMDEFEEF